MDFYFILFYQLYRNKFSYQLSQQINKFGYQLS